jgi:hypothetical protein
MDFKNWTILTNILPTGGTNWTSGTMTNITAEIGPMCDQCGGAGEVEIQSRIKTGSSTQYNTQYTITCFPTPLRYKKCKYCLGYGIQAIPWTELV